MMMQSLSSIARSRVLHRMYKHNPGNFKSSLRLRAPPPAIQARGPAGSYNSGDRVLSGR